MNKQDTVYYIISCRSFAQALMAAAPGGHVYDTMCYSMLHTSSCHSLAYAAREIRKGVQRFGKQTPFPDIACCISQTVVRPRI